ncbi:FtsH protease activity modulator HflK, partial [bacterium]|nr:FtsH protease activity modulator HflK [bacterium]
PVRLLAGAFKRTGWSDRCRHCLGTLTKPRNRRRMLRLVMWVVVLAWLSTSLVFVGPGRQGVVMRFGSAGTDALGPGLHVKAPWPVDRVVRVQVSEMRRIEVGFRTRDVPRAVTRVAEEFYATLWESRHAAGTYEKMPEEALRLTGDENIIDMNVVVCYRVSKVNDYVFNVAEREDYIRFIMESVMSKETGSLAIDDILTVRRGDFEDTLRTRTQELLDSAAIGVEVTSVRLQDIHPPLEVVPAFRDVASAREDKNRIMNEAYGYANQTIPRARGEAGASILEAQGYSHALQSRATGDADRFVALAKEHRKAPTVTETRLYIETMESLLQGREKYIVSSDLKLKGYDIRVYDQKLSARVPTED